MIKNVVLAGLSLLVLIACASSDENGALAPSYELVGTVVTDLPVNLGDRDGCTFTLTSGGLDTSSDYSYTSRLDVHRDCSTTEKADSVLDLGGAGTYELAGDTVRFFNNSGSGSGFGFRTGDTLRVIGPSHVLVFAEK